MELKAFTHIYQTQLTPKHKEVLHLFLAGCSDDQIIQQLGATHRTSALHHLKLVISY